MLAALGGSAVPERASDDYVRDTFDRFAADFDTTLEKLSYQAPSLLLQEVQQHLGHGDGSLQVLDAGCGTGLCGPLLRPYARRLAGIDLSAGMLSQAGKRAVYDELLEAELLAYLQTQQQRFDLIACADTLCYFGELAQVLERAAHAMRPDALLAFTLERLPANTKDSYQLGASGRYAHGEAYVRHTLQQAGFKEMQMTDGILRQEAGQPVCGWIISARAAG
jgi:predicted TPR repeat methyltransferase